MNNSRYEQIKLVYDGDTIRQSTPDSVSLAESSSDVLFVVSKKYVNRIDLISYKFYNNPNFWWVIAKRNNLYNPMILPLGTTLSIPNISLMI